MLTGGTDNHLLVLDVASTHGITGRQAEDAVRRCGITLNRNPIPFDPNGPWYTSGLRFGAAAVTTLGMGKTEMDEIAAVVALVLKNVKPGKTKVGRARQDEVHARRDGSRPGPCSRQEPAGFVSGLSGDRSAVSDANLGDRIVPKTHQSMKLSRDEERFLRCWIYDEVHYRDGQGPAKRLQLLQHVIPADLATLIAAAIPDLVDQETAALAPPPGGPLAWPWSEETFRDRLAEARAILMDRQVESRRQA